MQKKARRLGRASPTPPTRVAPPNTSRLRLAIVHHGQLLRCHDGELDFTFFHPSHKNLDIALAEKALRGKVGLGSRLELDLDGMARFAGDDAHAGPFGCS